MDEITPLHKKSPKQCLANYRPVTLMAVPCKILESLVRDQLMDHLSQTNQLNSAQHGFRPKRSCCTQLLETGRLDQNARGKQFGGCHLPGL